MKILIVKIEVADDLEAYKIVSKLGMNAKVKEAKLGSNAIEKFGKGEGEKPTRYFLQDPDARQRALDARQLTMIKNLGRMSLKDLRKFCIRKKIPRTEWMEKDKQETIDMLVNIFINKN